MAGFWQRMVDGAPRQLRFTSAGKVLIGIALFAGLAAMNTGNNLLFLVWGLVLSAIVISGVLSEGALRILQGKIQLAYLYRAHEPGIVHLALHNSSKHLPAFGLRPRLEMIAPNQVRLPGTVPETYCLGPYLIRLDAKQHQRLALSWLPKLRGCYWLEHVAVETAYPFGFFVKSRRLQTRLGRPVWVAPARVVVTDLLQRLRFATGYTPMTERGSSDEYLALRPYRNGDDPRRIAWRRSARIGRLLSIEMAKLKGQMYVFELHVLAHAESRVVEQALSTLASLAEVLLQQELAIGILAPGIAIKPQLGPRQWLRLALALAKCDWQQPTPNPKWPASWQRWGLLAPGLYVPAHVHGSLPLASQASQARQASTPAAARLAKGPSQERFHKDSA